MSRTLWPWSVWQCHSWVFEYWAAQEDHHWCWTSSKSRFSDGVVMLLIWYLNLAHSPSCCCFWTSLHLVLTHRAPGALYDSWKILPTVVKQFCARTYVLVLVHLTLWPNIFQNSPGSDVVRHLVCLSTYHALKALRGAFPGLSFLCSISLVLGLKTIMSIGIWQSSSFEEGRTDGVFWWSWPQCNYNNRVLRA